MKRSDQRGQGLTEYIILVALIAIAAIAAVRFFGTRTKEGFQNAADQVGGVNQDMKDQATKKAGQAIADYATKK